MAKKINLDQHSVLEGIRGGNNKNRATELLWGNSESEAANPRYKLISIYDIVDRPINDFSMDEESIRDTAESIQKNGLLQPVIVGIGVNYPDDSEVAVAFAKDGVDVKKLTYVTCSGHRRIHAIKYLHELEKEDPNRDTTAPYKFEKVLAKILTPSETKHEKEIYLDTNLKSRKMGVFDMLLLSDLITGDELTLEEKKEAVVTYGGNVGDKFDSVKYARYYLEQILFYNTQGIADSSIRSANSIHRHCPKAVRKAIIDKKYPVRNATHTTDLPEEVQLELLNIYLGEGEGAKQQYEKALKKYKPEEKEEAVRRKTYNDAIRVTKKIINDAATRIAEYDKIYPDLGDRDKALVEEAKQSINDAIKKLAEIQTKLDR